MSVLQVRPIIHLLQQMHILLLVSLLLWPWAWLFLFFLAVTWVTHCVIEIPLKSETWKFGCWKLRSVVGYNHLWDTVSGKMLSQYHDHLLRIHPSWFVNLEEIIVVIKPYEEIHGSKMKKIWSDSFAMVSLEGSVLTSVPSVGDCNGFDILRKL